MRIKIPSIICGEVIEGEDISLKYETKDGELEILMSRLNDEDVEKILLSPDNHNLTTDQIISFYVEVGKLWKKKNYNLRRDAINLVHKVTGYSKEMVEHSYNYLNLLLSKEHLEHTLHTEIRDIKYLDEWIKIGDIFVHAQPRGRVLHILAGNAPPIAMMSMIRGSLTKNANLIKVSSGDPITPVYFALSLIDIDKNHPITKSTSVFYFESDSEVGNRLISSVNAICVWGGIEAVENIRRKSRYGTELLEFGPRRSMQLIGSEAYKNKRILNRVTDKVAHDIVLFDQEACHSPQFALLEGNPKKFCESLAKSLDEEGKRLPKGHLAIEKHAQVSHERLLAKFYGEGVYSSKGTEWTLIIPKDINRMLSHPLSRTLYVFGIKNLKDSIEYADRSIQTVAIYPPGRIKELRDELTAKGVDRITEIGRMGYFAPGAPHDGIYPLSHLVRWVKSR